MEHLADELDARRLVGVLFLELHHQPKCAIFEGGIGGPDDDSVPSSLSCIVPTCSATKLQSRAYQVMTLSAIGDAETPAGGSVCIRCRKQRVSEIKQDYSVKAHD